MTKDDLYKAAQKYVEKNHSQADNDFQNAMNIAVAKAFIAGAEWMTEKQAEEESDICLECKNSKYCSKSSYIKSQCIEYGPINY